MSENVKAGDCTGISAESEENSDYESIEDVVNNNNGGYNKVIERIDRILDGKGEKIELGEYSENGKRYTLYAYVVGAQNSRDNNGKTGGVISAGAHGDEPRAVEGLIDSLEKIVANKEIMDSISPLIVIPVLSPGAYDNGTRENGNGIDINRQFWLYSRNMPPEVKFVEDFILSHLSRLSFFFDCHYDNRFPNRVYTFVNNHPESYKIASRGLEILRGKGYNLVLNENIDGIKKIKEGIYKKDYDVYNGAFGPPPNSSTSKIFDIVLEIYDSAGFSSAILEMMHGVKEYQPKINRIYPNLSDKIYNAISGIRDSIIPYLPKIVGSHQSVIESDNYLYEDIPLKYDA